MNTAFAFDSKRVYYSESDYFRTTFATFQPLKTFQPLPWIRSPHDLRIETNWADNMWIIFP